MDWDVSDLTGLPDDLEAFKQEYYKAYPSDTKHQVDTNASTIHRFVHSVYKGDQVALSNAKDQWIYLGIVAGAYAFNPPPPKDAKAFRHQRAVRWLIAYPRAAFSDAFNASLKSELTLFSLDTYADEIQVKLLPGASHD